MSQFTYNLLMDTLRGMGWATLLGCAICVIGNFVMFCNRCDQKRWGWAAFHFFGILVSIIVTGGLWAFLLSCRGANTNF